MYGGNSSQYSSGSYGTPPPQQYQQQQQQQQQQSGQPQWVKASNGQIPPGAIIGGLDKNGEPLFIARAYYNNGIHPGEAGRQIEGGGFSFSYDSDQIFLSQYEVLCGNGKLLTWVDQEGIPNFETFRPFRAGREESGEELYVGKTLYDGAQPIGKCGSHFKKGLIFGFEGKEKHEKEYKILAYA